MLCFRKYRCVEKHLAFWLTDLYVVLVYPFFLWHSSLISKGSHLFVNDWQAAEKINFRDCRFSGSKRQHLRQAHQEDPIHVHWCRGACPSVCGVSLCQSVNLLDSSWLLDSGVSLYNPSSHVSISFQCLRVYNREVKLLAVLPSHPGSGSFFLTRWQWLPESLEVSGSCGCWRRSLGMQLSTLECWVNYLDCRCPRLCMYVTLQSLKVLAQQQTDHKIQLSVYLFCVLGPAPLFL